MGIGFSEVIMNESYIRNLPIPYFSQRENGYIWKESELALIERIVDGEKQNIPNPNKGNIIPNGSKQPCPSAAVM